jgi:hypothetical protein
VMESRAVEPTIRTLMLIWIFGFQNNLQPV